MATRDDAVHVEAPAQGSRFFARKASGLVREVSWLDAAMYNLIWSSIPLAVAFVLAYGTAFYVGADLGLATLLAFVFALPTAFTYAMLSGSVPRSGGDYPWISRTIHPAVGFASNLSFSFWATFFIGIYAVYLGFFGIGPVLRVIAAYTQNLGVLSWADFFFSSTGVLVTGAIVILGSALLLSFGRGLRGFMRFQRYAFILWMGGAVLLPIIVLLFVSPDAARDNFNSYAAALGGPTTAAAAYTEAGQYADVPVSLPATLLAVTLPYYTLGFIFQSAYFGGEIKRGARNTLLSIPGAQVIAVVLILLSILVLVPALTPGLLAGTGFHLAGEDLTAQTGFTFAPIYTELAAIASGNIVVGLLITVGMLLLFILFVPQTMILLSRNLFAWSFDRLMPGRLAEVNERTHSPVVAIVIIAIVGLISVAIVGFNPELTFIVGLLGLTWTYVAVAIAGVLFPYRQRETFEASPYNRRVGGVPVLSIVSGLSLLGMAAIATILLTDENSGTSLALNADRVLLGLAVWVIGLVLYFVIRAIQNARGVNVDLAYREIPPD